MGLSPACLLIVSMSNETNLMFWLPVAWLINWLDITIFPPISLD